jgi:hypothetical protein
VHSPARGDAPGHATSSIEAVGGGAATRERTFVADGTT